MVSGLDYLGRPLSTAAQVTTASAMIIQPNARRRTLWLVNTSDEGISIALGLPAVVDSGIRLNAAGGSLELSLDVRYDRCIWTGAIYAIHGGVGNKNLAIMELD